MTFGDLKEKQYQNLSVKAHEQYISSLYKRKAELENELYLADTCGEGSITVTMHIYSLHQEIHQLEKKIYQEERRNVA